MGKVVLTARFLDSVKVEARKDFWDSVVRGLVFRASPSGVKSWSLVYSRESDGARQRFTLGAYPVLSLADARVRAIKALGEVADGTDPAAKKKAQRASPTVKELGEDYIKRHAQVKKRSWREDERVLKRDVYPTIGHMKANKVTKRDIRDLIAGKHNEGKAVASRLLLSLVRKVWNFGVSEYDDIKSNPANGLLPMSKATERDRVLSDAEIAKIIETLPRSSMTETMQDIILVMLLTGQRLNEVVGMTRGEVSDDIWEIPAQRSKNKRVHSLPLLGMARQIVERRLASTGEGDNAPIFALGGKAVAKTSVCQAIRRYLQGEGERWTGHDLRRSVATMMNEIGILPHVVEAVLNHVSGARGGVARIYNQAQYDVQIRAALSAWDAHLHGEILGRGGNGNVVSFARA
jgi:integrase